MITQIYSIAKFLIKLPRVLKLLVIIFLDIFLCFLTVWFSYYLRLDKFLKIENEVLWSSLVSISVALPIFFLFKLYKTIFRYSGVESAITIFPAFVTYTIIYSGIITIYGIDGVPRTVGIIQPILLFFAFTGSRKIASYLFIELFNRNKLYKNLTKAIIYGAGNSGSQLATSLNKGRDIKVVGFLDDDNQLIGRNLNGIKIYSPLDIKKLVLTKRVTHILLAIPSVKRSKRMKIIDKINQSDVSVIVKTLPSVSDIVEGKVTFSDIRDLDVADILGREQVEPDNSLMSKNIENKVVLVTGAGGSIGQELCRQILKLKPSKILLLDNNEFSLYSIHSEIENIKSNLTKEVISIIPLLGSVQDKNSLKKIFSKFKPDTVYHVAAYKHVPMVETNIIEGIKNNVFGTIYAFETSIENNVKDFVLVSTDKAVRPTNIMGASKRLAELCTQGIIDSLKSNKLNLSIVRFGNVIESSGSVIPKFKKQILNGGPVTLTHQDVTRYFMTIPEAAQLVIQAGAMSSGNDLFVLDMGKSIKIADLLNNIIKLSGLTLKNKNNPEGDIEISITGLRSGEKLYEELLLGENPLKTIHTKIFKVQDPFMHWDKIENDINKLNQLTENGEIIEIIKILKKLVTGFEPSKKALDIRLNKTINYF